MHLPGLFNRDYRAPSLLSLGAVLMCSLATMSHAADSNHDWAVRVTRFFAAVDRDHMAVVDEFYAPDVEFADPMGQIQGRSALRRYYEGMYRNVETISFEFKTVVTEGDTVMAEWVMTATMRNFNGGRPIITHGMSRIQFDSASGLAVAHRDSFDMGEMVYERIPVFGRMVRWIRRHAGKH